MGLTEVLEQYAAVGIAAFMIILGAMVARVRDWL